MQKKTGVHFYINIANFDDVAEKEESATHEVRHSIHALDTFFSCLQRYTTGKGDLSVYGSDITADSSSGSYTVEGGGSQRGVF